jgi:hypothetical protein
MPKFRKKPVVIEAWQNTGANVGGQPQWFIAAWNSGVIKAAPGGALIITTLEGDHRADVGDWIIQGVKGELYPCKPDIFERTYDAV